MKLKRTIAARDVKTFTINRDIIDTHYMKSGDLGVFEIIKNGKHEYAQMDDGKNHAIFPGDHIVAAFAARYATAQFEGYVPDAPQQIYHILGAGGVIGVVKSKNFLLKDVEPTTVKLIGYCCNDQGEVINTQFYGKERHKFRKDISCKVILSIGSTMDSGKTTTSAYIAHGLKLCGAKVAYIKLTGTCYTKDRELVKDCGADFVTDFSDLGFPSTYMCSKEDILDIYQTLTDRMKKKGVEYIIMEIADGLMQRETNFLLKDKEFSQTIHRVVFNSGDSLSAFHGVQLLKEWGIEVVAVAGMFTTSPLLVQEVQNHLNMPVLTLDKLMIGEFNPLFLDSVKILV